MTTQTSDDLDALVVVAFDVGWTMAVLYGGGSPVAAGGTPLHLPTEQELAPAEQATVEVGRLGVLLTKLSEHPSLTLTTSVDDLQAILRAAPSGSNPTQGLHPKLVDRNFEILRSLGACEPELSLAYQLGRCLHDSVHPPLLVDDPATFIEALRGQLERGRVAKLQEWFATLAPRLGDRATVVSASLGRWSEFFTVAFVDGQPSSSAKLADDSWQAKVALAGEFRTYLINQGDIWRNVLVGNEPPTGFLTPEAYMAAGEAALSRTVRMIRKVLLHHWIAMAVVAAAFIAVMVLAGYYLAGAAKVWTQIAAIASTLGVSVKGISGALTRLSEAAEKPLYRREEVDAMAWAITTLPPAAVSRPGRRALQKSGIQPPAPLGKA
jgi:hypothetical protein